MNNMTTTTEPTPNLKQKAYIEAVRRGANTLLTGPGGTGKSFTLDLLRKEWGTRLSVAATTGIAALNVGGLTIHSWAGLGLGTDTARHIAHRLMEQKGKAYDKIISARRLAIDEVSMMSADLLTLLDQVLRLVRRTDAPFGGIQMLFIGDFLQLPPVVKRDTEELEELFDKPAPKIFAFNSPAWEAASIEVHQLTEIVRQKDQVFASILNKIRRGIVDEEVEDLLHSRLNLHDENSEVRPVKLNGYNKAVDAINHIELAKIDSELALFEAIDDGRPGFIEQIQKNCIAPELLTLKVGAQVMLLRNLHTESGLVNGALGIVRDFDSGDGLPMVEFAGGQLIKCEPKTWEISRDGDVLARRTQVPLRLAWAWTIHKSQGQTIDKVEVDLSSAFECGQAYVALSRVHSLEGLFLSGLKMEKIRANKEALSFYGY
jgi:ATP-dependent DNA helicase PIF1